MRAPFLPLKTGSVLSLFALLSFLGPAALHAAEPPAAPAPEAKSAPPAKEGGAAASGAKAQAKPDVRPATAKATKSPATPKDAQPAAKGKKDPKAFDPEVPATWKLSAKLGKGTALREQLLKDLAAPAVNPGEAPLTAEEASKVLDDPRAELIYGDKTVSIVAPSMIQRQRKDHLDLMALFLKPERVQAGVKFAREQAALLEKHEKAHGVPRGTIVGILMWESRLGTITGDYVAFNAFTSQAFFIQEASAVAMARKAEKTLIDPARQEERVKTIHARARKNLLALMRQCKARGIDPLTPKGSWAGALGFPQFMPASLRWAEDGDGDGKIDLFTFPDSIASIANYLEKHGYAKSAEKAVWDYNHEDAYVKGVLAFGKALEAELAKPASGAADAGVAAPAPADAGATDAATPPPSRDAGR